MAYEAVDCIDAGTDYCPCYLAETNNCLICSQLQGKVFCDCVNWKGVCIYQEYIWNGSKIKEPRENLNVTVLKKEMINPHVIFIKVKLTKTLVRELNQPGSYIFIRDSNYPDFFDVPMSIMYCDETNETADILVQIRGVKTKVLNNPSDSLMIRGPYWNGIIGLKNIKSVANKNCLVIARGIAQAPSVLVAKKLCFSHNNVTVLLDPGTSETNITKKLFEDIGCNVIESKILNNKTFNEKIRPFILDTICSQETALIFSGGSDLIHKYLMDIIKSSGHNILFSYTNNSSICCGEGICGSCNIRLKDGRRIKACKAQIDPIDIMGGK